MRYQLTFALNEDDYLEYNLHFNNHNPAMRRNLTASRFAMPLGLFGMFLLLWMTRPERFSLPIALVTATLASAAWVLLFKRFMRSQVRRSMRKLSKTGRLVYGREVMCTFNDEGINIKTADGESSMNYSAFIRVVQGEHAVYLYQTVNVATIVPSRAFKDEDERAAFARFMQSKVG